MQWGKCIPFLSIAVRLGSLLFLFFSSSIVVVVDKVTKSNDSGINVCAGNPWICCHKCRWFGNQWGFLLIFQSVDVCAQHSKLSKFNYNSNNNETPSRLRHLKKFRLTKMLHSQSFNRDHHFAQASDTRFISVRVCLFIVDKNPSFCRVFFVHVETMTMTKSESTVVEVFVIKNFDSPIESHTLSLD